MKKRVDSVFNGKLYAIRFDADSGLMKWISPYAWLEYNDKWYLVKYRTPEILSRLIPGLISECYHEAWEIDKSIFLAESKLKVDTNKINVKSKTNIGNLIALPGGSLLIWLLFSIVSKFLPANDRPSYVNGLLISLAIILILLVLFVLIGGVFRNTLKRLKGGDIDFEKIKTASIGHYKIKFEVVGKSGILWLTFWKWFSIILVCLLWAMILLPSSKYALSTYNPLLDSSSGKAVQAIIVFLANLLFLTLAYYTPVLPIKSGKYQIELNRVQGDEI